MKTPKTSTEPATRGRVAAHDEEHGCHEQDGRELGHGEQGQTPVVMDGGHERIQLRTKAVARRP